MGIQGPILNFLLINLSSIKMTQHTFFLCIGAQKAGTTYLGELISLNPSVHIPDLKEFHFWDLYDNQEKMLSRFADELRRKTHRLENCLKEGDKASLKNVAKIKEILCELRSLEDRINIGNSKERYLAYFNKYSSHTPVQATGEITPAYGLLPEWKLKEIKELLDPKIIFMMRDPFARFKSHVHFDINHIPKIIGDLGAQSWKNESFITNKYLRASRYKNAITKIDRTFDQKNIFYLFFEDFIAKPSESIKTISSFLGVDFYLPAKLADSKRKNKNQISITFNKDEKAKIFKELKGTYLFCKEYFNELPESWETISDFDDD